MTENKQYTIRCDEYNAYSILKNNKDVIVFDLPKSDAELICNKLNELSEENKELQGMYDAQRQLYCQLNSDKNNIWQDYQDLKKENEQLKERNNNQYYQLQHLWKLIEAKDWETLTAMVNQMKKDNERLQREWSCYND